MPNMGTKIPNMGIASIKSRQDQPLSMVDALFSKTKQNVLALLYGQPEQSFYTNEIIKKLGGGSGAVQRELSRLIRSGLVIVIRIGSQNHYQANPDAPIYGELCAIMQKTVGLAEPLSKALEPLSEQIQFAFVYGSVAKHKDTATSDIDLMLVSDSLTYADVFAALESVSSKLRRTINPTVYSRKELQSRIKRRNSFIKRVLAQPKLWIIGQESDLPAG